MKTVAAATSSSSSNSSLSFPRMFSFMSLSPPSLLPEESFTSSAEASFERRALARAISLFYPIENLLRMGDLLFAPTPQLNGALRDYVGRSQANVKTYRGHQWIRDTLLETLAKIPEESEERARRLEGLLSHLDLIFHTIFIDDPERKGNYFRFDLHSVISNMSSDNMCRRLKRFLPADLASSIRVFEESAVSGEDGARDPSCKPRVFIRLVVVPASPTSLLEERRSLIEAKACIVVYTPCQTFFLCDQAELDSVVHEALCRTLSSPSFALPKLPPLDLTKVLPHPQWTSGVGMERQICLEEPGSRGKKIANLEQQEFDIGPNRSSPVESTPFHGFVASIPRFAGAQEAPFPLIYSSCLMGRVGCDILVSVPMVDKKHCRLDVQENKQVAITSLTTLPTWLNGEELFIDETRVLNHGDVFTLGNRSFRWNYPERSGLIPQQTSLLPEQSILLTSPRGDRIGSCKGNELVDLQRQKGIIIIDSVTASEVDTIDEPNPEDLTENVEVETYYPFDGPVHIVEVFEEEQVPANPKSKKRVTFQLPEDEESNESTNQPESPNDDNAEDEDEQVEDTNEEPNEMESHDDDNAEDEDERVEDKNEEPNEMESHDDDNAEDEDEQVEDKNEEPNEMESIEDGNAEEKNEDVVENEEENDNIMENVEGQVDDGEKSEEKTFEDERVDNGGEKTVEDMRAVKNGTEEHNEAFEVDDGQGEESLREVAKKATRKQVRRPHVCSECNFSSAYKYSLQRHFRKKHEMVTPLSRTIGKSAAVAGPSRIPRPKPRRSQRRGRGGGAKGKEKARIPCKHCGKDFAHKGTHALHVKGVHGGRKDKSCPLCEFRSHAQVHVQRHINAVHLRLKNHVCPRDGCEYKCSDVDNLFKHEKRFHLKETRYGCDKCSYRAYYPSQVKAHSARHDKEKSQTKKTKEKKGKKKQTREKKVIKRKQTREKKQKVVEKRQKTGEKTGKLLLSSKARERKKSSLPKSIPDYPGSSMKLRSSFNNLGLSRQLKFVSKK